MKKKIFIDGQSGTTGLKIRQRLENHPFLDWVQIPDALRKDKQAKKEYFNSVDLVVLCLPDEAARESAALVTDPDTIVVDASTAHRLDADWTYGLPELSPAQREVIRASKRISVPGCYPTGFILAVAPLVRAGVIPADYPITIQAVSGYSGGGSRLIDVYQKRASASGTENSWAFRPYALSLNHKHLPEMKRYAGLERKPVFVPGVAHIHQGMLVMVPLFSTLLAKAVTRRTIEDVWREAYQNEPFVQICDVEGEGILEDGFLSPATCNQSNRVDLMVFGHDEQILLVARLDNLGKGASGAAVQNINILLDIDEQTGLV